MNSKLLLSLLFLSLSDYAGAQSMGEISSKLEAFNGQIAAAAKAGQIRTSSAGRTLGLLESKVPNLSPGHEQLRQQVNGLREKLFSFFSPIDQQSYADERIKIETGPVRERLILKVAGEYDLVTTLFPKLWADFMNRNGATEIEIPQPSTDRSIPFRIKSRRPRQASWDVVEVTPTSSDDAIIRLTKVRAECDLAFCLREATDKEKKDHKARVTLGHPAFATIIGLQPIVLAVGKKGSTKLTKDRIESLMKGKDSELTLMICDDTGFAEAFLGPLRSHFQSLPLDRKVRRFRTPEALIDELRKDSFSIGLLPMHLALSSGLSVQPLATHTGDSFVLPTAESVWCETYPITSPLIMFCNADRPVIAKQFKSHVSNAGQSIIKSEDIFPPGNDDSCFGAKFSELTKYSSKADREYISVVKDSRRVITPFRIRFEQYKDNVELYSSLNPLALPNLKLLMKHLSEGGWRDGSLILIGHADNTGADDPFERAQKNKEMGLKRAQKLAGELESLGLPIQQPTLANSMGEEMPMASNPDLNRRVELWFASKTERK